MRLDEVILLLVILLALIALYIAAGRIIVLYVYQRITGHKKLLPKYRYLRIAILILAGIVTVCLAYAHFIEPYRLTVTRVVITSSKLPAGSRPIRIVHISDLHCDAEVRLEDRLPGKVAALEPDVILFTGDAANSLDGVPNFRRCMTALAQIAPVYAVRGNWDYGQEGQAAYEGLPVRMLLGRAVLIELAGHSVWLGGADPTVAKQLNSLFAKVPEKPFTIFLHHTPDEALAAAKAGVDLYLAGHTHGGQICIPFYGAIVTLSSYGKRFEGGLSRVARDHQADESAGGDPSTWVFVTRGIGMEGHLSPRMRFFAPPEVALIEIRPQQQ